MSYQRNDRFCPTCTTRKPLVQPSVAQNDDMSSNNGCDKINTVLNPTMIAMVYAPKQEFHNLYDPMKALLRGTLFADLDKPFAPYHQ